MADAEHRRAATTVLATAVQTVAAQLDRTELRARLTGLPSAPEHRLRRPPGPVSSWPAEAFPPGTIPAGG